MIDRLSPAGSLMNGTKEPEPKITICLKDFSFIFKTNRSRNSCWSLFAASWSFNLPSIQISNLLGARERLIRYSFPLDSNSTSTAQFFLFRLFTSCPIFIFLKGFPKRPNEIASINVDLPAPLVPITNVVFVSFKSISVN